VSRQCNNSEILLPFHNKRVPYRNSIIHCTCCMNFCEDMYSVERVEIMFLYPSQIMTVSVFLCIDTGVIFIGDTNTTGHCFVIAELKRFQFVCALWETEVLKFVHVSVEVKCVVTCSITDLFKFCRKLKKHYNGCLWENQM